MCYKRMYENSTSYIALQTSLKHIFIEELITKHISLKGVNFNHLIIPAGIEIFFKSFLANSMKVPLQSKPSSLKQIPLTSLSQILFFECESHCSYFKE